MATEQKYPPEWESYADIANFYDRVRSALGLTSSTDIANSSMDYPEKLLASHKFLIRWTKKAKLIGWMQ